MMIYLKYIAPIPWELTSLPISKSPCTFLSHDEEHNDSIHEVDKDHLNDLPKIIQYKNISMTTWTTLLN